MGVKWKTTKNQFPKMITQIEKLNKRSVEVGVIEGEHKYIASILEYGCTINVTPKMRAFLHYHGLHLSKNTKTIKIPERSFLRASHDKYADEVLKKAGMVTGQVLDGKMSTDQLLDMIGKILRSKVKDYATDLTNPPNHPYTIEQKGSSNPLVDTKEMIRGISWRKK